MAESSPAGAAGWSNPDDGAIRELLREARTVAVVGLSPKPERPSHGVARYLQEHGYRIIPVNPGHAAILGEICYPSLQAIPAEVQVDVVDVFRRPEEVPGVVEETLRRGGVRALWLQLGVIAPEAARRAREAGLLVVMDRCMKVEHERLLGA
ncbi:MAG: CoA-binding protein [Clostridia bacterium]|nr:CoA-binding protein [Clostridia bacterium]MCL6521209.1 CoA-binding protein [Bacillota bacterium]